MTKKLRIDSRGLVDDKDLNVNVVTNSAGHKARRVKLHDGTIVWEVQAPDHLWNFESESGDFIDEVNEAELSDTEITTRVDGLTSQLGQAIELDAGVTVLSSDVYPIYSTESFSVNQASVDGYNLMTGEIGLLSINQPVIGDFAMREAVINYQDGLAEEFKINQATIGDFSMAEVVVTYDDGLPEEFEINQVTIGNFSMETVVIAYDDDLPEEFEINQPTIGNFSMS